MKELLFFLLLFSIGACSYPSQSPNNNNSKGRADKDTVSNNSEKPDIAVKLFLTWYRKNYKKLYSRSFVPSFEKADYSQYRINQENVNHFLAQIKESKYFTNHFIENLNSLFNKSDSIMLAN